MITQHKSTTEYNKALETKIEATQAEIEASQAKIEASQAKIEATQAEIEISEIPIEVIKAFEAMEAINFISAKTKANIKVRSMIRTNAEAIEYFKKIQIVENQSTPKIKAKKEEFDRRFEKLVKTRILIDTKSKINKKDAEAKKIENEEIITMKKAKTEAKIKAKEEAEAKAKIERKAITEAELKAKVEAELKAKAEAELKAKTEFEAKAKADIEAKAKTDLEAKTKAEIEAKTKAEI